MNKAAMISEFKQFSTQEQRELIEEFRGIVGDADKFLPLTQDELDELDRRFAEHEKNPDRGSSWEEVQARLRARFES